MTNSINNSYLTIIVSTLFISGITLAINFPDNYILPSTIFIAIIIITLLKFKHKSVIIIALITLLFGFYYTLYRAPQINSNDISKIAPQKNITLIGNVISEPGSRTEDKLKFNFEIEKTILNKNKEPNTGKILVTVLDKYRNFDCIKIGNRLKLTGNLYIPNKASNPYQFDYLNYLQNKEITCNLFVLWKDYQILSPPETLKLKFLNYLSALKNHIQDVHNNALGKYEAQLLGGIVLGERAIPMDREVKQHFIKSGLVHILAASGINVALLALAWIFVTSKLSLPYNVQIVGGMIIVLFYSLLTGLPPSVLRASVMLEFILLGKLFDKDANMISIIFFVATLLLLINPYMLFDVGFQLSFVTAFGLIVTIPVCQKYIKTLPQALAMLVLVPIVAQIWAMPVIMFYFHNFSTYSVVANFFAMPLVAIITYCGFVSSVISVIPVIGIPISSFIDSMLSPVLSLLLFIADYISNLPFSFEHYSFSSIYWVLLFYSIIGIILYAMWKEYKTKDYLILCSVFIITFIGIIFVKPYNNTLNIVFFDVGDADSILITTPDNKNVLIDGGYRIRNSYNSADWILKPYLYGRGNSEIQAIILTHTENDHIGGIPEILDEFKVHQYFDPGAITKNSSYKEILHTLIKKNIPYQVLREKDEIYLTNDIKLKILSPAEKLNLNRKFNENSLIIRLDYKHFSLLLCGDAEKDIVKNLNKNDID
ncbi:MAG: DNA internalization-related competence protein ComEC/Rec2, partial [Cyanobacteriota bacterium]